jgi:hypothetical protein
MGRLIAVFAVWSAAIALNAQRRDVFIQSRDHPAIRYSAGDVTDSVYHLNQQISDGAARLTFDPASGYLRSVLEALNVPVESQALVFSQTSFQAPLINIHNPRAVFFNDHIAVGWVSGGAVLEVAAQDPRQGVVFYALEQKQAEKPQLVRNDQCLACHLSWDTLGVPGFFVSSVYPLPDDPNAYANGFVTTHGSPLEQRWGGWWVTGTHGGARHMGNIPVMPADKGLSKIANPTAVLPSVAGLFDLKGYPSPYSDVVAMLVLAHQTNMTNLITRLGWEARLAAAVPSEDASSRVSEAARDAVDYLLFVDEAPLPGPVVGSSGFAERFAAAGPRDTKGRSLRELDLRRRLFRYPCSYMVYTEAFDSLPAMARDAVYARLWEVLSGRETQARYRGLLQADRKAIIEILRDTKKNLPEFFRSTR